VTGQATAEWLPLPWDCERHGGHVRTPATDETQEPAGADSTRSWRPLLSRVYDAVNRRDLRAFLALMDADVEAFPRIIAIEGGFHGHDGIRR
jgi:hypothetical protein